MNEQQAWAIEQSTQAALSRASKLAGLTDEWVTRIVVRKYFQTMETVSRRRHLVDVGAAAGGIALDFLRDGWTADLFEPDPAWEPAMGQLARAFPNSCRVHRVAVCGRDVERISFSQNRTPGLSGLAISPFGSPANDLQVRGVRLDTILKSVNQEHVDFLKIDTEGSDFEVLDSFPFEQWRPPLVFSEFSYYFPSQNPETLRRAVARMQQRGYASLIFEYDDDGNFKSGNWQHRLIMIWARSHVVPERATSFGNVLFYRENDERLVKVIQATIDALG